MKEATTKGAGGRFSPQDKETARAYIRKLREEMTAEEKEEKSRKAAANAIKVLESLRKKKKFSWAYCYMDLKKEAGTGEIISWCMEQKIRVALPKVTGGRMEFLEIASLRDCEPGAMGILEPPAGSRPAADSGCPVIVPGVAFGPEGSRLGYGGGYYDRFFSEEPLHIKLGYCMDFQVLDRLPSEGWDERVDFVITDQEILDCRKNRHSE